MYIIVLIVIGCKVNMVVRLMVNYLGILLCDDDIYRLGKFKLKKEDFVVLFFIKLKGVVDFGIVWEYNSYYEWVKNVVCKKIFFIKFDDRISFIDGMMKIYFILFVFIVEKKKKRNMII